MKTYHKDIFLPRAVKNIIKGWGKMSVRPTNHALERAEQKSIVLPRVIDLGTAQLFEVSFKDNDLIKFGVRYGYNETQDICIMLNNRQGIITSWLNSKDNQHSNLDRSNYVPAP